MLKPKITTGDVHIVCDGKGNKEKIFDHAGRLLKTFNVFPHGANGPRQDVTGGDTVEQLYKLGKPIWTHESEDPEIKRQYGWVFIPMIDFEGKETALGRAGFGCHGGGRLADHWAPRQELTYTMGCVRHHNEDVKWLARKVEDVLRAGNDVWMSVDQPG